MKLNRIFMLKIFFIFLSPIICSNGLLEQVKYIKTFELENGNIIFCTEKGILLLDEGKNEIKEIEQSKFDPGISKEDFNFVTISQFEEGEKFIVIIYKIIIFILTSEGVYFTKENINIDPQGKYYTLVPYKVISTNSINKYHFVIGYLGNGSRGIFLLSDFCLDKNSKNLNLTHNIKLNFTTVDYSHYGFSCNKMKSNLHNEVLTCFFHIQNALTVSSFNLHDFSPINSLFLASNFSREPINIKSMLSSDKSKSLVCYLKGWNYAFVKHIISTKIV